MSLASEKNQFIIPSRQKRGGENKPEGRICRGRPRLKWLDEVENYLDRSIWVVK